MILHLHLGDEDIEALAAGTVLPPLQAFVAMELAKDRAGERRVPVRDLEPGMRVLLPGDDCDQIVEAVWPNAHDPGEFRIRTNGGTRWLPATAPVVVL